MNECMDDRNEYLTTFGIYRISSSDSNVRVHAKHPTKLSFSYLTATVIQSARLIHDCIAMAKPQFLSGDKSAIDAFLDRFDVSRLHSTTVELR
jgi:hypothetical protein